MTTTRAIASAAAILCSLAVFGIDYTPTHLAASFVLILIALAIVATSPESPAEKEKPWKS